ncbi:MAG TPA: hypothetical protein VG758_02715 [Hyphomicrobiaceae bacterium]|jgi:hypothetical protein|nr:hypothetical protein [Hyphomicrobiaceae bacterium]
MANESDLTLEGLDRRVAALELAQSARSENALARLEQKVDAFPRVVAEMIAGKIAESEDRLRGAISTSEDASEDRLRGAISTSVDASEQRMRAEMRAETQRILAVLNAAERRTAGLINDTGQRILVALDRLKNP